MKKMTSLKITSLMFAVALLCTGTAMHAQHDPMVGGAAMFPSKNIVENALNSQDHTTLVAAVKAGVSKAMPLAAGTVVQS